MESRCLITKDVNSSSSFDIINGVMSFIVRRLQPGPICFFLKHVSLCAHSLIPSQDNLVIEGLVGRKHHNRPFGCRSSAFSRRAEVTSLSPVSDIAKPHLPLSCSPPLSLYSACSFVEDRLSSCTTWPNQADFFRLTVVCRGSWLHVWKWTQSS